MFFSMSLLHANSDDYSSTLFVNDENSNLVNLLINTYSYSDKVNKLNNFIDNNKVTPKLILKENKLYIIHNKYLQDNSGFLLKELTNIILKDNLSEKDYNFIKNNSSNTKIVTINNRKILAEINNVLLPELIDYKEDFNKLISWDLELSKVSIIPLDKDFIGNNLNNIIYNNIANLDYNKVRSRIINEWTNLLTSDFYINKDNNNIILHSESKPNTNAYNYSSNSSNYNNIDKEYSELDTSLTSQKLDSLLTNVIINTPDFDYSYLIRQFDYNLDNSWELTISTRVDSVFNDYFNELVNSINSYPELNPKQVLYKNITWENRAFDNNLILDISRLEKTYIPWIINNMELISYRIRSRYKYDPYYRRHNISQVYNSVNNNLYIFNKWDTFNFDEIYRSNDYWKKYLEWLAIFEWWIERNVYGGGVCWASTWIYQWSFLNSWLKIKTRAHSKWYSHLYSANINWTYITTPGLDSTYFWKNLNMIITNISDYPIWMLNTIKSWTEYNFTVSFWFNNVYSKNLEYSYRNKKCYNWKIWDEVRTSCYRKIL